MDNGEEIPGLNESWTFLGAKPMEWISGFGTFLALSELVFKGNMGGGIPFLLGSWVATTVFLATLRQRFPDEERGLANLLLITCGFAPPKIPVPSLLQKKWSGAPVRELNEEKEFMQLGLDKVFAVPDEED